MTDQPLFETKAVDALIAAGAHLERALAGARSEDQRSTMQALEALTAATTAARSAETHLVRQARRQQMTWRQIAEAVGVTRQAATARHRPRGLT